MPGVNGLDHREDQRVNQPEPVRPQMPPGQLGPVQRQPQQPEDDADQPEGLLHPLTPVQPVEAEVDQVTDRAGLPFDPLVPQRLNGLHAAGQAVHVRAHHAQPAQLAQLERQVVVLDHALVGPRAILLRESGSPRAAPRCGTCSRSRR